MVEEKQQEQFEDLILLEKEKSFIAMAKQRCKDAKEQRDQAYDEFDGQTYGDYYFSNMKANNSFIPPKLNDEDVRITGGTTKEKTNTLLSAMLNYNLEPEILAFNEDEIQDTDFSRVATAMVRKSSKLEKPEYETKRALIYHEFLAQGIVYARERWREYGIPKKILENMDWSEGVDPSKIKWNEQLKEAQKYCDTELLCGLNVYVGNIKEYYMELQPYVVTRRKITYGAAKSLYNNWTRFKYVHEKINKVVDDSVGENVNVAYENWNMVEDKLGMVEEIEYMDKWTNEYQIFLNGVPMLPVGFPLSFFTGESEYPIAVGKGEPIHPHFFYCKSVPAKTKVDQQVFDEFIKLMVLKTRKSFKPPYANNTGLALSQKIHMPGTMLKNIPVEKLVKIGESDGVSNSEFAMVQFLKQQIDNKSVSPIMEGQQSGRETTAREIIEMKQQAMTRLGAVILGIINFEKRRGWLRLLNILKNWGEPIDSEMKDIGGKLKKINKYRTISGQSEFENGEMGERIMEFTDQPLPEDEQTYAEERVISRRKGIKIRKNYISTQEFKKLQYKFFVEVVPTEKTTNELKKAVWMENLAQWLQLFGMDALNMDYVKSRSVTLGGEDPNKILNKNPAPPMMPGMMPGGEMDMSKSGMMMEGQKAFQTPQAQVGQTVQ